MVVFLWTIAIGILNGTDVVDFDRKVVLSHVHVGTLGWITLSVFAAAMWLFGADLTDEETKEPRALARFAVVALPAFALTFAVTYEEPRAILGTVAMITIVGVFAWVVRRLRRVELSVVHLGFLAAVATSVIGAVIGVLLATRIATGREVVPDGAEDAHPATMVVGFLIPVGMALAEWGLGWPTLRAADRAGRLQVALPFIGGIVLMIGLLGDIDALPPIAALIELVGVGFFVKRNGAAVRRVAWLARGPGGYAAACAVGIVANIVFLNYLIGANDGDVDLVATHQILALDHMMFVGVLTNGIFALLQGVTSSDRRWEQYDRIVFVAMNAGLLGFVVSLLAEATWLERIATPVLGAAIIGGLALHAMRLRGGSAIHTPPIAVAAT
jgi:hypothetical protein